MSDARVVKRYANRKLYDTRSSRYVTLDEIAGFIRAGEDVRIIDNDSKDDLTSVTLAQVLLGEEKRQGFLPLETMRGLIQTSGESLHQIAGQLRDASGKVGERALQVFRRGDISGLQKDVETIEARLAEIEKRVAKLEK
ncbi:MAG: polyhydroxyalkanoate synthesis regulator DNA-binding domain-containing protein [Myxococcota bacterium]